MKRLLGIKYKVATLTISILVVFSIFNPSIVLADESIDYSSDLGNNWSSWSNDYTNIYVNQYIELNSIQFDNDLDITNSNYIINTINHIDTTNLYICMPTTHACMLYSDFQKYTDNSDDGLGIYIDSSHGTVYYNNTALPNTDQWGGNNDITLDWSLHSSTTTYDLNDLGFTAITLENSTLSPYTYITDQYHLGNSNYYIRLNFYYNFNTLSQKYISDINMDLSTTCSGIIRHYIKIQPRITANGLTSTYKLRGSTFELTWDDIGLDMTNYHLVESNCNVYESTNGDYITCYCYGDIPYLVYAYDSNFNNINILDLVSNLLTYKNISSFTVSNNGLTFLTTYYDTTNLFKNGFNLILQHLDEIKTSIVDKQVEIDENTIINNNNSYDLDIDVDVDTTINNLIGDLDVQNNSVSLPDNVINSNDADGFNLLATTTKDFTGQLLDSNLGILWIIPFVIAIVGLII